MDAAPLYVVWEDLPLLAKEGVTSEEARWVPERAPLRVIKESYTSGSREFDHSFLKSPRGSLGFVGHHEAPVYVPEAPVYVPEAPVYVPEVKPHLPEIQPHLHEAPHVHEPPPHVHEAPHVPEVKPHVHEAPHVPEHVPDVQPHEPEPPVYVPASPPVTKAYPGPPLPPPPPQYSVRPGLPRKYYLTEEGQQEHRRVPGLRQYYLLDAQGGGGRLQEELPLELPPVTESEIRLQEHLSETGPPSPPAHPPPPPPQPHSPHTPLTYIPTHSEKAFGHPPPYPPVYYPPHPPKHYPPPTPPTVRQYYLNSRLEDDPPRPEDRMLDLDSPAAELSSFEVYDLVSP